MSDLNVNSRTLSGVVLDYTETIQRLVPEVRVPSDWDPLAQFVDVGKFERIGTFLEVQDWQQYVEMLTQWASTVTKFETTVRRVSELSRLVYYEVEERHFRDDFVHTVRSMTVFEFDEKAKISNLAVYLEQAR